jgi:hypothetical protein
MNPTWKAQTKPTAKAAAGLAVALCSVLLFLLLLPRSSTIPPNVQMQSSYSRSQAEVFYANANRSLRQIYWGEILRSVRNRQLRDAWKRLWNGTGMVEGVITDLNSNIVACVKCRNGEGFWITVLEHQPARSQIQATR